jgi:hypothetical protein
MFNLKGRLHLRYSLVLIAGILVACGGGAQSATSSAPLPERSPQASVSAALTSAKRSAGPFYLDGTYKLRFSITHSSEQCLLVVYARAAGESIGTVLFSDVVFGNTGSFPEYQQSFNWDNTQFYGEDYTLVSEGACEDVRVELASSAVAPSSSSGATTPAPTASTQPIPTPLPTLAPQTSSDIASSSVCSFVRTTQTKLATDGFFRYAAGQISLRQMGSVYGDWAKDATNKLRLQGAAKAAIKAEVERLISVAQGVASAARAGRVNTALDLTNKALSPKALRLCSGY